MANATDQQVQSFSDSRIRPQCEQARSLALAFASTRASIDDVYAACSAQNPTWSDNRTDGPPHLLTPSDILAINAFMADVFNYITTHGQYPIVQKACVRAVVG